MQVTTERLQAEMVGLEARLKETEASANKIAGAILMLKDVMAFLELPEAQDNTKISAENAKIQARDEAVSLQQVAEIVAGPGATADEPEEIK